MSDRVEELKSYLPELITNAEPFKTILEVYGTESNTIFEDIDDLLVQFFIDTATWGIRYWEEFVGIESSGGSIEERRVKVKDKLLDKANIKKEDLVELTKTFYDGLTEEIRVTELFNDYIVFMELLRNTGITPDFEAWINALRQVVPAHLVIKWDYPFNRYSFFKNKMIYSRMRDFTWKQLREQLGIENL